MNNLYINHNDESNQYEAHFAAALIPVIGAAVSGISGAVQGKQAKNIAAINASTYASQIQMQQKQAEILEQQAQAKQKTIITVSIAIFVIMVAFLWLKKRK